MYTAGLYTWVVTDFLMLILTIYGTINALSLILILYDSYDLNNIILMRSVVSP